MSVLKTDEIKYCAHCGSANKASEITCCECQKKTVSSYKPFYDFLKKHTKEEIAGKVTDTFFSCLRKFLMSHIYGVALSVTIVATAASAVYSAEPHIEKISDIGDIVVNNNQVVKEQPLPETTPVTNDELSEEDLINFEHLAGNCDVFADARRTSESYWDMSQTDYADASEMYAERNIGGFNYGGVHEMISNPISMPDFYSDPRLDGLHSVYYASDRFLDASTAVIGENCTTEIAKKLLADGYRVAECNYVLIEYAGENEYDSGSHSGDSFMKKLIYKFVFVEHNEKWYIAEDRLVEEINK